MIFTSDFLYKTYVVGTHLNCLDLSRQFNEYPQHMLFTNKWIKVDGLSSDHYDIIDCVLIGVCAVIRSNTVCMRLQIAQHYYHSFVQSIP